MIGKKRCISLLSMIAALCLVFGLAVSVSAEQVTIDPAQEAQYIADFGNAWSGETARGNDYASLETIGGERTSLRSNKQLPGNYTLDFTLRIDDDTQANNGMLFTLRLGNFRMVVYEHNVSFDGDAVVENGIVSHFGASELWRVFNVPDNQDQTGYAWMPFKTTLQNGWNDQLRIDGYYDFRLVVSETTVEMYLVPTCNILTSGMEEKYKRYTVNLTPEADLSGYAVFESAETGNPSAFSYAVGDVRATDADGAEILRSNFLNSIVPIGASAEAWIASNMDGVQVSTGKSFLTAAAGEGATLTSDFALQDAFGTTWSAVYEVRSLGTHGTLAFEFGVREGAESGFTLGTLFQSETAGSKLDYFSGDAFADPTQNPYGAPLGMYYNAIRIKISKLNDTFYGYEYSLFDGENWGEFASCNTGSYARVTDFSGMNGDSSGALRLSLVPMADRAQAFSVELIEVTGSVAGEKATPAVTATEDEFVYNGQAQAPAVTVENAFGFTSVTYRSNDDSSYTAEMPKDAGSYIAKYECAESFGNAAASVEIPFTISPKSVAVVWGNTELTYNGERQIPTATADTGIAGETLTITVTVAEEKGTNAEQNIAATASMWTANGNYTLTNTETTYSIVPKSVAVVWSNTELTYSGERQIPTATADTGIAGETLTIAVTVAEEKGTNAEQNISVTASIANGNYTLTNAETTYSIAKATPSITESPTLSAIEAGQTAGTLSGGTASVAGTFSLADAQKVYAEAGTYQVDVVFTPEDSNNYETVTLQISLTVEEAETPTDPGDDTPTDPGDNDGEGGGCSGSMTAAVFVPALALMAAGVCLLIKRKN